MRRNVVTAVGLLAAVSLLLTGCSAVNMPSPSAKASVSSSARSPQAGCPDITASDFAVQIETTASDPGPLAKSVGLGDVLEGTCAYGFLSDRVNGVAFFIIDPAEDDAAVFFGEAVHTAARAGFAMGNTKIEGQNMNQHGANADGASFGVTYYPKVQADDAAFTPTRMATIGVRPGDSIIFGSIQLP